VPGKPRARPLNCGSWVSPKTGERLSAKTQRNVSDAFRTFLRWLERRGLIEKVPAFPRIEVTGYEPRILTLDQQAAVLAAIPWDRRGAFLAGAFEALRLSEAEIRALDIDDYEDGWLDVSKAVKGNAVSSPIRVTKNRSSQRREVWSPELKEWIEWRIAQATPEARLRGEIALFWNPTARNAPKRWAPDALEREWNRACEKVGVRGVPFQQGTRHTTLTALSQELPERVLRQFSRHRHAGSLDHYTRPRATPAAIVRALRSSRAARPRYTR